MTFVASFDVEDWFHAENVRTSLPTADWTKLEARVERNTNELLDLLAGTGARATFFVLGWIARRYPRLVARMATEGHEVASHSDLHQLLYSLPPDRLVRDLADARDALEQAAQTRVWGLRAPNFSIGEQVLDCLAEAGYWYDSSFHDLSANGRYGRLTAEVDGQPVVEVRPGLLELPLTRLELGPVAAPWAGGGYFRIVPYALYRRGVARMLRRRGWFMFYLHPWELDADEPRPAGLPPLSRFRAYHGRGQVRRNLTRLLREFGSVRIDEALRSRGHSPPGE